MDSDEHIVRTPLPATQVPHASETIALVVAALVDRLGGEAEIAHGDLVINRGRVMFKESMDGVRVWLERR